jgi:hypothetical protein
MYEYPGCNLSQQHACAATSRAVVGGTAGLYKLNPDDPPLERRVCGFNP